MSLESGWSRPEYEAVVRLVGERTGLTFPSNLHRTIEARIQRAKSRYSAPRLFDYSAAIASDAVAFDALVGELTVGETYFFREPDQFDFLRSEVIPELVRHNGSACAIRAWSAGCASGEEAYSLAIMLRELGMDGGATVIGTDLDPDRLRRARDAEYSRWSLRGVPEAVVRTYFEQRGRRYRLAPEIRSAVRYRRLNLVDDCYPSVTSGIWDMDVVLCRNVLIYLDAESVARIAQRLIGSLSADGWLFLGASDPMLGDLVPCEVVVTRAGVAYRRRRRRSPPDKLQIPSGSQIPPGEIAFTPAIPEARSVMPDSQGPLSDRSPAEEAASFYAAGEYGRAAALLRDLVDRDGSNPEHWIHLVRALANQGRLTEAERACTGALDQHQTSAVLRQLHAVLLSAMGQELEAAGAARRALYLDRRLVMAHLTLGHTLLRLGDRSGAERAWKNAERLLARTAEDAVVPGSDGKSAGDLRAMVKLKLNLVRRPR